jgi:hypothetical protein
MRALIDYICSSHREREPDGPLITLVGTHWAYCAGGGHADHEWMRIVPSRAVEDAPALVQELASSMQNDAEADMHLRP